MKRKLSLLLVVLALLSVLPTVAGALSYNDNDTARTATKISRGASKAAGGEGDDRG